VQIIVSLAQALPAAAAAVVLAPPAVAVLAPPAAAAVLAPPAAAAVVLAPPAVAAVVLAPPAAAAVLAPPAAAVLALPAATLTVHSVQAHQHGMNAELLCSTSALHQRSCYICSCKSVELLIKISTLNFRFLSSVKNLVHGLSISF
jgi:hypothetical protein